MNNGTSRIVADGEIRLREAKDTAAVRERITAEVLSEFREQLAQASLWRRFWLGLKIRREIRKRLDREFPPAALYLRKP